MLIGNQASHVVSAVVTPVALEGHKIPALNQFGGAAAAYSLRRLKSWGDGARVVDVRRSSDDTTKSFSAKEEADGTLVDWVGSGDGYVSTWYDQSGNGNHAVQNTATSQPKIVDAGTLVADGLKFDGTDDYLNVSPTLSQPVHMFSTYKALSNNSPITGSSINSLSVLRRYTGEYLMYNGAVLSGGIHPSTTVVCSALFNGSNSKGHWDGVEILSGNTGPSSALDYIGRNSNAHLDGTLDELIIYDSDQSANREAIETNINDHYEIY